MIFRPNLEITNICWHENHDVWFELLNCTPLQQVAVVQDKHFDVYSEVNACPSEALYPPDLYLNLRTCPYAPFAGKVWKDSRKVLKVKLIVICATMISIATSASVKKVVSCSR
jgi:hypothetical protein